MHKQSLLLIFQSTLSVRRATYLTAYLGDMSLISIHALREESDLFVVGDISIARRFQSTLSVRRATLTVLKFISHRHISIHALREESDNAIIQMFQYPTNFNPRSP